MLVLGAHIDAEYIAAFLLIVDIADVDVCLCTVTKNAEGDPLGLRVGDKLGAVRGALIELHIYGADIGTVDSDYDIALLDSAELCAAAFRSEIGNDYGVIAVLVFDGLFDTVSVEHYHAEYERKEYVHQRSREHDYYALPNLLGVESYRVHRLVILAVETAGAAKRHGAQRVVYTVLFELEYRGTEAQRKIEYFKTKKPARGKVAELMDEYHYRKH